MMELKTRKNARSVQAFLNAIDDPEHRRDSKAIARLMGEVTGARPSMWGDSIVGFGDYHYRYASGREGDWFVAGFAPRKAGLTVYLMCDLSSFGPLLAKLGRHKAGKGCLHIRRLEDVSVDILREMIGETARKATGLRR